MQTKGIAKSSMRLLSSGSDSWAAPKTHTGTGCTKLWQQEKLKHAELFINAHSDPDTEERLISGCIQSLVDLENTCQDVFSWKPGVWWSRLYQLSATCRTTHLYLHSILQDYTNMCLYLEKKQLLSGLFFFLTCLPINKLIFIHFISCIYFKCKQVIKWSTN